MGTTIVNRTTANGFGDNNVYGVYAVGSTVYAATGGLGIVAKRGGVFPCFTRICEEKRRGELRDLKRAPDALGRA